MDEIIKYNPSMLSELTGQTNSFCSMSVDTHENKLLLYKAMNNPDKRIGDCINMEIRIKDVYCEVAKLVNKDTGEIEYVPRTVLIDDKGISYQAISKGVFTAVSKLFQVFGAPTWCDPITVKVRQISKGDRNILTLDVI